MLRFERITRVNSIVCGAVGQVKTLRYSESPTIKVAKKYFIVIPVVILVTYIARKDFVSFRNDKFSAVRKTVNAISDMLNIHVSAS